MRIEVNPRDKAKTVANEWRSLFHNGIDRLVGHDCEFVCNFREKPRSSILN